MKYCPNCKSRYADDSLWFCLEDGSGLLDYSGRDSQNQTQDLGETETFVRQNQTPFDWEQSQVTRLATLQPTVKKSNTPLIIILTPLAMCVFLGGATGLWLLLSGGSEVPSNINTGNTNKYNSTSQTPTVNPTPNNNTGKRIQNDNRDSVVNGETGWKPTNYQASLQGTNLTYYRGTTAVQCQADCDANHKCKAYTLIRAGAYNPNDPPMCYLISEVTGSAASSCCISAIKNKSDDPENLKACEYFIGRGLYDKWKQKGGENGVLGCPTINETEADRSPEGTTGRMTQFSKGDGGYIIRHDSGRFSGTAFEVSGCMFKLYADIGGTGSWLGFPIKDGYRTSTGARQDFERGYILWDSKTYNCHAYKNY